MTDVPTDSAGLQEWVREFARRVAVQRDLLTDLDAAIGDADHGTNLDRGLTAVVAALDATLPAGAAPALKTTGMTLVSTVGGASGPLYGTLFLRMAAALAADGDPGTGGDPGTDGDGTPVEPGRLAAALRAGVDGLAARGRAAPGDKTMIDALVPACDALEAALADGELLPAALAAASRAADAGRDATTPLQARKGRASYLGERSIGHQDPGATSAALLVGALAGAVGEG